MEAEKSNYRRQNKNFQNITYEKLFVLHWWQWFLITLQMNWLRFKPTSFGKTSLQESRMKLLENKLGVLKYVDVTFKIIRLKCSWVKQLYDDSKNMEKHYSK